MDNKKKALVACAGGLAVAGLLVKALKANAKAVEDIADSIDEMDAECDFSTLVVGDKEIAIKDLTVDALKKAMEAGDFCGELEEDNGLILCSVAGEHVATGEYMFNGRRIGYLNVMKPDKISLKNFDKSFMHLINTKLTPIASTPVYYSEDCKKYVNTYVADVQDDGGIIIANTLRVQSHEGVSETLNNFSYRDRLYSCTSDKKDLEIKD